MFICLFIYLFICLFILPSLFSTKLPAVFPRTLFDLFSRCYCPLWQYFVQRSSVCSDLFKVILLARTSVTPPSPPSDFLLSLLPLYPRFAGYCEYCVSSLYFRHVFGARSKSNCYARSARLTSLKLSTDVIVSRYNITHQLKTS